MKEKVVSYVKPILKNKANIAINMTDYCNFSCKYCVTWKKFSWKFIDVSSFDKIEKLISKLKKNYESVNVTLTWGEPTLEKDFFIFLRNLLDLNINLKVNTNGFVLHNKQEQLQKISHHKNIENLNFNVTFHFLEYYNKSDIFISSLSNLENNKIYFWINFLLPDNIELEKFQEIKDKILSKVNVKIYNFSLIKSTNWKISESYKKEMLDYFNNNYSTKNERKNIEIIYENWEKEMFGSSEVIYKDVNKFSWFKCNYFTKDYLNVYIETDLSCCFWSCYTLNRLKYSLDEVSEFLDNFQDKSIICGDHSCLCESDFNTPKSKTNKYNQVKINLEKIIQKIKPIEFELWDITIGENSIQIVLQKVDVIVFVLVEKIIDKSIKYPFSDWYLWYQYFVKNKDNEFINVDENKQLLVNIFLKKMQVLKDILRKILENNKD